jgi:acyl carrier protein
LRSEASTGRIAGSNVMARTAEGSQRIETMSPAEFYGRFGDLVREMKPDRDIAELRPDTHLWATGFVDSVSMLEIVEFLEDLIGQEIDLSGNFLQNFTTMETIYTSYVAGSASLSGAS